MRLTIKSLDYAPEDLYPQEPIDVELLRELAGPDRPDYWLARSERPIYWMHDNHQKTITHLILAARWQGTRIQPGIEHLPVGIAFVLDDSVLTDAVLDLQKCYYSAIGIAYDTTDGRKPRPIEEILTGQIAAGFQTGVSPLQSASQKKPWWRFWTS